MSITQEVQSWDVPGLDGGLEFISEFTNFLPGLAIWTAAVAIFIWRGLRVEALVLLMALVTFSGSEALGVLVDRPRPSSELVHVSQALKGNGFPSGHVFGAVVFYGLLVAMVLRRTSVTSLKLLAPAMGLSIVVLAGLARVFLGVHWPSDVLGGLLLGSAGCGASLDIRRAERRPAGVSGSGVPSEKDTFLLDHPDLMLRRPGAGAIGYHEMSP